MPGYSETVPARDIRKGDVFSSDGGVVVSVALLQGGGVPDEIMVQTICHGIGKFGYFGPDVLVHLWREDQ